MEGRFLKVREALLALGTDQTRLTAFLPPELIIEGPRPDPKTFPDRLSYREALVALRREEIRQAYGFIFERVRSFGLEYVQPPEGQITRTLRINAPADRLLPVLDIQELVKIVVEFVDEEVADE